ncbi:MAG TPA: PEP-CTERM/exosortase system-associated acyltransferase [Acetobacteraceae bacterium]|nr:PEP-CTERM/exosortase system-associated acyltransferase [Acetobacteraceae bacterium]
MRSSALENAILKLNKEVSVELADTPAARREAFALRYQVYCIERNYEPGYNGIEQDGYDDSAVHAVARWRQTGKVIGTVRLILPNDPPGNDDFPMQRICDPGVLDGLPRNTIGEVSRFALAKWMTQQMRRTSADTAPILRLALIRGAVWLSAEVGHTHWVAMMEHTLLRVLRATGIHFVPLGAAVDYHGLRQPAVAELVPTMARLAREQPVMWEYITRSGTWYSAPAKRHHTVPEGTAT